MPQRKQYRRGRRNKRGIIIAVALGVIICAVVAVIIIMVNKSNAPKEYPRYKFDEQALAGQLSQMSAEEAQAALDEMAKEGMFNISILSGIAIDAETMEGTANIENSPSNKYHMQVQIYLDGETDPIYTSDLIQPGYYIERIKLNRSLPAGEYSAKAVFNAITQDTFELYGQTAASIMIYVK